MPHVSDDILSMILDTIVLQAVAMLMSRPWAVNVSVVLKDVIVMTPGILMTSVVVGDMCLVSGLLLETELPRPLSQDLEFDVKLLGPERLLRELPVLEFPSIVIRLLTNVEAVICLPWRWRQLHRGRCHDRQSLHRPSQVRLLLPLRRRLQRRVFYRSQELKLQLVPMPRVRMLLLLLMMIPPG